MPKTDVKFETFEHEEKYYWRVGSLPIGPFNTKEEAHNDATNNAKSMFDMMRKAATRIVNENIKRNT